MTDADITKPANVPITITKGGTFRDTLTFEDENGDAIPLTGYTGRMEFRDKAGGTILFVLTTEDGGLAITGATGTVTRFISATDTADLEFRQAVYDLRLVGPDPDGDVVYWVEGFVSVREAITQAAAA